MRPCEWCGGSTPVALFDGQPFRRSSDGTFIHELACSEACAAAALQRAKDEGRFVLIADLTAERARTLLSQVDLCSPVLGRSLVPS